MAHHHDHHNHGHTKDRNLLISIVLNVLITIAQIIGGFVSGSLALLSDALHNFSDVISLIVSYIASKLSKKKASVNRTFGYKRAEILAAFINAATLIIVAVILIKEAIFRFNKPEVINSNLVIWLALLAIVFNGLSVLLLKRNAEKNLNVKSAYIHLITDVLASVAVLVGGILMKYYKIYYIDSLLTLLIALYLIWMGFHLLLSATKILMLFTPDHIHIQEVTATINKLNHVKQLHHVHLWSLSDDEVHLEAHLDLNKNLSTSEFNVLLEEIERVLFEKYSINHVTIQPEFNKLDSKEIIVQD